MGYDRIPRRQNYEPAMSFDEIALKMGMKRSTVQLTYAVAMRKLMDKAGAAMVPLQLMRGLVAFSESLRPVPRYSVPVPRVSLLDFLDRLECDAPEIAGKGN